MKIIIDSKLNEIKFFVFEYALIRFVLGLIAVCIGLLFYPGKKTRILSVRCVCWAGRVTNMEFIENISLLIIKKLFLKKSEYGKDTILSETCIRSNFFENSKNIYSIQPIENKVSIFRDLIILKERSEYEKGVILIKYTPAFDAFINLFDVDKIFDEYYLVLEPSWAGSCDPSFLLYWREFQNKNVIVQALEPKDYNLIERLGGNFIPIGIGSSDWVDQDLFCQTFDNEKKYDLVMVSNWSLHKKHKELFKALSRIQKRLSVLLIGFPWSGRTRFDIEREIKEFDLDHVKFEIRENIPPEEVSRLLNKSKIYVLLSRKEGGNKSIIEAFFANVPAILYNKFVGGVQAYINEKTGVLSSYDDLNRNILYMLENYSNFSPRSWILENSGSKMSTERLNTLLKDISLKNGEKWFSDIYEKINSPNLSYKNKINNIINSEEIYLKYKR